MIVPQELQHQYRNDKQDKRNEKQYGYP